MKKLIIAAAMLCMGANLMAQEVAGQEKSCQDWVNQFEQEIVTLKADVAKVKIESKAKRKALS